MSSPSVVTLEADRQACTCGQVLSPKARFCPECGEPRVRAVAAARPTTRRAAKRQEPAAAREPDAALILPLPAKVKSAGSAARDPEDGEPGIVEDLAKEPVADEPAPATDEKAGQAAKRRANRAAQREESLAAWQALDGGITEARRKALSTLTGASSVAMLGLAALGLIDNRGNVLALAVVFLLLTVCFLCWRRDRRLTQAEYLSIPHSRSRNGRLRCIHCGDLGASLREAEASRTARYDCAKCGENLFSA